MNEIDSSTSIVFQQKMIPFSISISLHFFLIFTGVFNTIGLFFLTAFLNKTSEIFDSRACAVLTLV